MKALPDQTVDHIQGRIPLQRMYDLIPLDTS